MKPVQEAVREAGISALIGMGCAVHKISGGKAPKKLFLRNVEHDYIGSNVKIVKETEDSTFIAKFNPDGSISDEDFTVVMATDMHIDKEPALMTKAVDMLYKHLRDAKPDLLVLTGDIIVTDHQQVDCVQFARFMEELGIYWAFVFGNHEARAEKEFHKYFMLKNLSKFPHCLSKFGDDSLFGFGNFFVNIMKSETELMQSLAFFDSGRSITDKYREEYNLPQDMNGYDFIKENQIAWYENNIKALQAEYGATKSMLFMHIPVPEYKEVFDFDENEKPIPTGKPTGKAEVISGEMHETIGCAPYNSGLFQRAKELGAQAFFAGHDHVNDFWAVYEDVMLAYIQMTGYEIYHMGKFGLEEKDWRQGVTIAKIQKDGSFSLDRQFTSRYVK